MPSESGGYATVTANHTRVDARIPLRRPKMISSNSGQFLNSRADGTAWHVSQMHLLTCSHASVISLRQDAFAAASSVGSAKAADGRKPRTTSSSTVGRLAYVVKSLIKDWYN
jgi:hypothetical protein